MDGLQCMRQLRDGTRHEKAVVRDILTVEGKQNQTQYTRTEEQQEETHQKVDHDDLIALRFITSVFFATETSKMQTKARKTPLVCKTVKENRPMVNGSENNVVVVPNARSKSKREEAQEKKEVFTHKCSSR